LSQGACAVKNDQPRKIPASRLGANSRSQNPHDLPSGDSQFPAWEEIQGHICWDYDGPQKTPPFGNFDLNSIAGSDRFKRTHRGRIVGSAVAGKAMISNIENVFRFFHITFCGIPPPSLTRVQDLTRLDRGWSNRLSRHFRAHVLPRGTESRAEKEKVKFLHWVLATSISHDDLGCTGGIGWLYVDLGTVPEDEFIERGKPSSLAIRARQSVQN
jgi:hypothetical protein